jgi:hypothetical protein
VPVSLSTARNIAIILIIAALIVVIPGGGTGANVALQAASIAFLATVGWFASVMYRQHRVALYSLGDSRRAILYVAIGVATLTLSATPRLWATGGGSVAWLVLIGACAYALISVIWSARRY